MQTVADVVKWGRSSNKRCNERICKEMSKKTNILFICHGNICRSTMAEFVFKDMVNKLGRASEFHIQSAATSREAIGSDTHYGTKDVLTEKGIPFTKRKAVQVIGDDYYKYDYLICMDQNNLRNLDRIIGDDSAKKVHLLLEYAGMNRDISDPWYTGNFDATYRDIVMGCEALLVKISDKN